MSTLNLDRSHITEESLTKLAENTNITHLAFGSKARILHDIINEKLEKQLAIFEENVDKGYLSGAEGTLVDLEAEVWGLERTRESKAFVTGEESNFNFFTLESNFGSINNDQDILITKGTRIFNTDSDSETKIFYIVTEDVLLPAASSQVFFAARSLGTGQDVNVGENTLNFHDFTNYADVLNNSLLVTNSAAVVYGKSELDDDTLKFLIKQQPLTFERANFTAIDTQLRRIPGIADVTRLLYRRGIGTSDWIIKATTPTVPATLLALAQETINATKSDGLDHRAVAPDTVGLQVFLRLTYTGRLETDVKTKIKATIRQRVIDFVNSLDPGQKLVIDQLFNVVLNSSQQIESVGTFDKKFDKLVVFKRSAITGSRIKQLLFSDYNTAVYERVIIEPGVETPVSIFDIN